VEWLNYHHLLYFWTVAREGSIARASATLRLAQPTISGQIRALEESLGEKLFRRVGRNLVMTDVGQIVYRFADEIFGLGRELVNTIRDRPTGRPLRFIVGIADVLPKLITYRLLRPALDLAQPIRIICREDNAARLLAALALHELDLVLTDAPISPVVNVRGFNHLLGECGVSIFGAPLLASKYRRGFPKSLAGAPFILPGEGTLIRRALEDWFEVTGIRPAVVGEFEDTALLNVFGQAGDGLFAAPDPIEKEIVRQHGVRLVGRVPSIREQYYAISAERKLRHPAVVAISEAAKTKLFAS
jgi:LysR family transcriptional activator of nhaA